MNTTIPACFFPLRKIILDDDHAFAQSILLKMHGDNFISHDSPKLLMRHMLESYKPMLDQKDLINFDENAFNPSSQHAINIPVKKLKEMLNSSTQQDISVLIVDHHMPEMCGLDFLKEINHIPIKKILITGEADYKIAVDALNNGLIDTYIRKDDPDLSLKLQKSVSDLEWKYFSELSSLITNIADLSFFKCNSFITEFKNYIKYNDIVAFCLTDTDGNFLLKNKVANQKYLLVRSKTQLQELAKIAIEDGGSFQTINNLQQGKVIPFFGDKKFWQIPASEWDKFLQPANAVTEDNNLFWISVDNDGEIK